MGDPLDRRRWLLVVLMSTIGFALAWVASHYHLGWRLAALATIIELALVCGFMLWDRDPLLRALLVFGMVVGFGELPTDAFSVVSVHTLVYPSPEPMIWASPLYMPFAWAAVMVQMGFISWYLVRRMRMGWVVLILALIGGLYVPLYEYLARSAGFWYYQDCSRLFGITPYYVILAEALLCAALPFLVKDIQARSWKGWIGLGIIESLVVYLATRLAFVWVG